MREADKKVETGGLRVKNYTWVCEKLTISCLSSQLSLDISEEKQSAVIICIIQVFKVDYP